MALGAVCYLRGEVPHAAIKVLVVEDSKATRELIATTLASLDGVEVLSVVSGFEALKVLPRHRFGLIVTDINMPDINGLELINFVKKNPHYRDTPLFVVTTEGRDQDRERGLKLGACEYLVKPFEPQTFVELVKKYLKR
jgi:two-component system, chemotaxis family, chemotaxis protein CheY